MTGPDPRASLPPALRGVEAFRLTDLDVDERTWTVRLGYAFDDAVHFTEVVTLPAPPAGSSATADDLAGPLALLHITAGTSYWKTAAPSVVQLPDHLSAEAVVVAQHCFEQGMREFAYRAGLDVPVDVAIEAQHVVASHEAGATSAAAPPGDPRPVIPVGGGKDSALCASILTEAAMFAVNAPGASHRVAAAAGRPLLEATRTIDPLLRELNEQGALNGHVPVTAITSSISVAVAALHSFDEVVMGIERSASEPTRLVGAVPVNHQHAKSWKFEQAFDAAVGAGTNGRVRWYSLLRPFSELAIARALVEDDAQMQAFLSCNRAFTIWRETPQSRDQSWCLECPKCLFTFLMFAPFLSVAEAERVFGGNPLADDARTGDVAALFSHEGKPFECVGEVLESAVALARLAEQPGWRDLPVVRAAAGEAQALAELNDATFEAMLLPREPDSIPTHHHDRVFARLAPEDGT